ncbi:MAG: NAD(P)-binding protein [Bacillota bacterium]|nr:NAD(P)-binding protein [Bacillota bacterium]
METIHLTIDGQTMEVAPGTTVLAAAKTHNIDIPTLCHHPLVETYGACGVCLVEAEGNPKLLRACATKVWEGMKVNTKGQKAEEARKIALELLLSDHRGDCRPPCAQACPANTDCQGYVGLIANGQYEKAVELIKDKLPLPASIGRVCPHPCEETCRRKLVEEPVNIAALKAFAADYDLQSGNPFKTDIAASTGKKVAIIGGGPAGLTAAYFLAKKGHSAEIYEAMPKAGGMLRYGIPQYRLPKEVLDKEIALIEDMGVKIHCNTKIGRDIYFEELEKKSDEVYVAIGARKSSPLGCPGEDAKGVLGGIDFLIDVAQGNKGDIGERVAVIGGGNTAMDACRTAMRLGAKEVYVIYRRTRGELPAEDIVIAEAMEEGVEFKFLVAPTEIKVENGKVAAIELQKMELGQADASGRRRPVPIEGATETLYLDTVIAAIGQKVVPEGLPVKLTKWNTIAADEHTFLTDRKGVFAGGDAINDGPGIAIAAIGHANKAADVIDSYLKGDIIPYSPPYIVTRDDVSPEDLADRSKETRENISHRDPQERRHDFKEVSTGYSEEQAKKEAGRCLECGCADYFECKLIKYGHQYNVAPQRFKGEERRREEKDEHPFIERNADKCILCGLCVRICEEVVGAGVLGLVQRGFDTLVKPEFGTPLQETDCISCGQCVSLCPTGALLEKWPLAKRIPLEEEKTDSLCGGCGMGCKTTIATKGDIICRILPQDQGETLCKKGRFGFGALQGENRLATALNRGTGTSMAQGIQLWREAMTQAVEKYGSQGVGLAIGGGLSQEEMELAVKLGKDKLKTQNIACLTMDYSGSPGNALYSDLKEAKVAYIGEYQAKEHPVIAMKLNIAKAQVQWVTEEAEIKNIEAEVIIVAENAVSAQGDAEAAARAKAIGAKLLKLRPTANGAVLAQMGIKDKTALKDVKALFVIGDEGSLPQNLDYLAAALSHRTDTVEKADLALAWGTYLEAGGSYTNNQGVTGHSRAVAKAPGGMSNIEILKALLA